VTEIFQIFLLGVSLCSFYWIYRGRYPTLGDFVGVLLAAYAVLAAYDGATVALHEYARTYDGRVTPGVVVALVEPPKTRWPRHPRGGPRFWYALQRFATEGSRIHEVLGRLILTGSPRVWTIEYRYDCERAQGCYGRDAVSEEMWRQTYPGQTIEVRRPNRELDDSRLEDNPQWKTAIVDVGVGGALLLTSGAVSGRLKRRGPRYLTARAVVTAIEPLRSGDEPAWRIKFAYFDSKGEAHEGTDEVVAVKWKAGDEGVAVFPPHRPELATFRPLETA
jgi:hypothetical protein